MNKKLWVLAASTLMSVGLLASCGGGKGEGDGYTYNTFLSSSPKNWNVHSWETSDESYVGSFCEIGLYDCILNDTKDGYKFVTEMASKMPVDVVDQLTDEEIDTYWDSNPTAGSAWEIELNQDACWEDGTPITAQDYLDSMELQLSPKYANYRADSYFGSNLVLANAENFFKQGRQTVESFYKYKNDTTGEVKDDSGFYYLNLGKYTEYVGSIFSNADTDTNFHSVLNQVAETYNVKLQAERIIAGYSYYMFWYQDHSNDTKWSNVKKPTQVDSNLIKDQNVDIDIDLFDNGFTNYLGQVDHIKTIKNLEDGWVDSNIEDYTLDALKKDLKEFVYAVGRGKGVTAKSWAWKLPLFTLVYTYDGDPIEFKDVGIKKIGDYKFRLYLARPITELNLKFSLSGNWLVNAALYKKLTTTLGTGYLATTYGSNSAENYLSYGPYKLEYFRSGDSFSIVRNEKWYGYKDGQHEGQFKMDKIETKIIPNHQTAMNEFLAGRLDDIDLTVTDYREYGNSGRCTTTYESYTQKLSFNTKLDKLRARQGGNDNKTVLANKNFREGLSLSLDRKTFASRATSGSKGFTGLLNDLYLANNSTGATYRSTPQGMSVYNAVYGELGGENIGDKTALPEAACGYNHALAVKYTTLGLKEELQSEANGHLVANNTIRIEFRVYDDESENTIAAVNFLTQEWSKLIDESVAALKAEGVLGANDKINFALDMVKDQDYYTTARNGGYDMIFSTWGGAAINPYGLMEVYCKKDFTNCCEYGFTGKQDEAYLAIDANGDGTLDVTRDAEGNIISGREWKSFDGWYAYMNDGEECNEAQYGDDVQPTDPNYEAYLLCHNRKLNVLAGLEAGIINRFEAIPLVARGTSSLNGFKTENATDTYVSLIGYGGIRFLEFNYTDAEWANFCKEHNNQLSDLYKSYTKGE